jgi:bifunctional UDP-N-acetylglucosamine pyrophosphorylase / glucosamine-1-phosphate N-acetyltransferase
VLAVAILAAGQGTRMRSPMPKVLHEAAGKPLLEHVLRAVAPLEPGRTAVIVGHRAEDVEARFRDFPVTFVRQDFSLGYGTGMALKGAQGALSGFTGPLLVLNGDGPLIRTETLRALVRAQAAQGEGMTLLTCSVRDPHGLGRIVRRPDGSVARIVEEKDATPEEKAIREINPGIYVFDHHVFEITAGLASDNAAGEYYLTDAVSLYLRAGYRVQAVLGDDETEILGVNDREQLSRVERLLLARD